MSTASNTLELSKPHQIAIQVDQDHLEKEAKAPTATALAELIWNALDADADSVQVIIARNNFGAVEQIDIVDDGHGIHYEDAEKFFAALGGSWKKSSFVTRQKRRNLHGKEGKGRLKAFALGSSVAWNTTHREGKNHISFTISGSDSNLRNYFVSAHTPAHQSAPGTTVSITGIKDRARELDDLAR